MLLSVVAYDSLPHNLKLLLWLYRQPYKYMNETRYDRFLRVLILPHHHNASLVTPLGGWHTSGPSYGGRPLRWGKNTAMNRQVSLSRVRDPAGAGRLRPLQLLHGGRPVRGVSRWVQRAIGAHGGCREWRWPATGPPADRWCAWENN